MRVAVTLPSACFIVLLMSGRTRSLLRTSRPMTTSWLPTLSAAIRSPTCAEVTNAVKANAGGRSGVILKTALAPSRSSTESATAAMLSSGMRALVIMPAARSSAMVARSALLSSMRKRSCAAESSAGLTRVGTTMVARVTGAMKRRVPAVRT